MTKDEIKKFKQTILETILPLVKYTPNDQIKAIITKVEKENDQLPKGFGNMLYDQILIMKDKNNL